MDLKGVKTSNGLSYYVNYGNKKTNETMKRLLCMAICLASVLMEMTAQTAEQWKALEKKVNFYVANDLGRNGYYEQRPIAALMGNMAENIGIECIAAPGDIHHYEGVGSTSDPLWMTNFELVYSHPELMLPWYPTLGNHEYRGNTQAVIDYSGISARWMMPDKYYTKVLEEDGVSIRLIFIDTTPMIDKYRNNATQYPDAGRQDYKKQLEWIDSVLTAAGEDWVIVLGHHPIYADTGKDTSERTDMQRRLNPILKKHKNVSMYICGHIHNFQHIRKPDCDIDYVVNTSGSLSRTNVKATDGTLYCNGNVGFSLVCADKVSLSLHLIDKDGKVAYTIEKPAVKNHGTDISDK